MLLNEELLPCEYMDIGAVIELWRRVFSRACLTVGPCFLAIALGFVIHTSVFLHYSIATSGNIISMASNHDNESNSLNFAPVFAFSTKDGRMYTLTSDVYSNPPAYTVGQTVTVLYEQKNPAGAKLRSFWQLWLFPVVFGILGGVATCIGYFLLRYERRQDRQSLSIAT
jgi:hypothetical protein